MTADKARQLCADFPELCRDYGGDMRVTCMHFGFSIEDGWERILRRLLETANVRRQAALAVGNLEAEDWRLAQVKEKWGLLRVYWCGGDDGVYAATTQAEEESSKTCEFCGSQENVTSKGAWIKTLCESCHESGARERQEAVMAWAAKQVAKPFVTLREDDARAARPAHLPP